jgi:hypothetical protein
MIPVPCIRTSALVSPNSTSIFVIFSSYHFLLNACNSRLGKDTGIDQMVVLDRWRRK